MGGDVFLCALQLFGWPVCLWNMSTWKWIDDGGDVYLESEVALVILHGYKPCEWDIDDFRENTDVFMLVRFDRDLILLSAWRFFVIRDLLY